MLRIRRVRRYRRARYPRGRYRARRRRSAGPATTGGITAAILMTLTEACDTGVGVTGPPPVLPEMVTENEARQAIRSVFLTNGIQLEEDVALVFRWDQDSLAFDVDGFNDSLQVGFEYVNPDGEPGSFSNTFLTALSEAKAGDGPYIEWVGPTPLDPTSLEALQTEIQTFIDLLRAQGII